MEGKARFIFPILMTAIIVFLVSAVVTAINIGFRSDYVAQWMRSFFVAWPIAAVVAFVAIPLARRGTQMVVGAIDGRK